MTRGARTPVCQVCGTGLELTIAIRCERCDTPHHRDCWEYWGRCSTYACTGLVHPGGSRVAPLRIVEEITIEGDAAPAVPSASFLDPIVRKTLMYFSEKGGLWTGPAGAVAIEIPATKVPLTFLELTYAPEGWRSPEADFMGLRTFMRRGKTAWIVREVSGRVRLQLDRGFRSLFWAPGSVEIVRTWESSNDGDGLLRLMARLALKTPEEEFTRKDTGILDISPTVLQPRTGEPREPYLEKLVRLRNIGRQIASMLNLRFHEQFAGSPTAR